MSTTIKVHIKTDCKYCKGAAYIAQYEAESYTGEIYIKYMPCGVCGGSGLESRWIHLEDFIKLIDTFDTMTPDYMSLGDHEPTSQFQDSRDSAGI